MQQPDVLLIAPVLQPLLKLQMMQRWTVQEQQSY
jgi:hypothetical protein